MSEVRIILLLVFVVLPLGWLTIGALAQYIDRVVARFATRGEK
jgi:hypothetical protein